MLRSAVLRAGMAVVLTATIAGCGQDGKPATAELPAVHIYPDGCPTLSAPSFGIGAKGERIPIHMGMPTPKERMPTATAVMTDALRAL
nr:hypothetical protein [uncultured Actinoplanes sp.]